MFLEKCNDDVYKHGQIVGVYSMPKEEAEALCQRLTRETGRAHDWHYSGGRVVVKVLPKDFYDEEVPKIKTLPESPWA